MSDGTAAGTRQLTNLTGGLQRINEPLALLRGRVFDPRWLLLLLALRNSFRLRNQAALSRRGLVANMGAGALSASMVSRNSAK